MRILHLGGYHSLTLTLARYQLRQGHEVSVWGSDERDYDFERPFVCIHGTRDLLDVVREGFDIVHIHDYASLVLGDRTAIETITSIRATGARVAYSHYGSSHIGENILTNDQDGEASALSPPWTLFDHVFLSTFENHGITNHLASWSWLPIGIDISAIPQPPVEEPPPHGVRILHIPYRISDSHSDHIISTVRSFQEKGFKFVFTVVDPSSIESVPALRRLIKDCHLFIEQVERPSFGPLAVDAMAHGRTVLSGNSNEAKSCWEELSMCPVLDTTSTNLGRRIESILKEPRCLRDLGKRSRGYAQTHHNAEIVNAMVLRVYLALVDTERVTRV